MGTQGAQEWRGTISRDMPFFLPLKSSLEWLTTLGPLLCALRAPWAFLYARRHHVGFYLLIAPLLLQTVSYLRQEMDLTNGTRMLIEYDVGRRMDGWNDEYQTLFKSQPSPQTRRKCLRNVLWGKKKTNKPGFEPCASYTFVKCLSTYFSIFIWNAFGFYSGCVGILYIFWIYLPCVCIFIIALPAYSLLYFILTVFFWSAEVINFDETYFINFFLSLTVLLMSYLRNLYLLLRCQSFVWAKFFFF